MDSKIKKMCIELAACGSLNTWEKKFIGDNTGHDTFTEKQAAAIERIYKERILGEKVERPAKSAAAAASSLSESVKTDVCGEIKEINKTVTEIHRLVKDIHSIPVPSTNPDGTPF